MKAFGIFCVAILVIIAIWIFGFVCNAGKVATDEFSPEALLKKYEWFKNASSELDKKIADIQVYSSKIASLKKDYESVKRADWDKADKETLNQWSQELAGIKSSYNSLCAEYNSQMSKINWKFCNVGDLPNGATSILPRNYKPYISE